VTGTLKSPNYKPSPIPSGGLEVPLSLKFKCDKKWVLDAMEEFVDNFCGEFQFCLFCFHFTPFFGA